MRESKDKEDHEIPMPEDLREGKDRMIFGNIEAIYEWHREWVFFDNPFTLLCILDRKKGEK